MKNEVKVKTEFCPSFIRQYIEYDTELTRGRQNYLMKCHETIIDLQDVGVRNALIALGWKPPKELDNGR